MDQQLSQKLRKAADEIEGSDVTMPGYVELFREAADALEPRVETKESLVVEIMALAYLIQSKTDHVVFIGYHGHVDSMDVRVCESKEQWQKELFRTDFHVKWCQDHYKDGDPLKWLKTKRDVLKHVLEEGEIPYGEMEKIVTELVEYEF